MPTYLLGIDVGTSGTKALLVRENGEVVASATTEYPLSTPQPLWAEQNPADWWQATVASIRRVLAESGAAAADLAGVGLTGQMHGLVLLDAAGEVLRPSILWNDQRTAKECAAITAQVGAARVLQLTGNPVLPGFTAPKILWVREHEPAVYRRVAKILLPKDYVRYRLTGEFYGEVSDASGTSLFDVGRRVWSDEMLEALAIPRAWLPEVTESPVISARVNAAAAAETGLLAGTPVAGGGSDQAAGAVGTGIVSEGTVSTTIGTSGVVFAASDSYRVEPQGRLHAFCHAVPGMWHLMGVMLSAAGSFRWYRDTLGGAERAEARASGRDVDRARRLRRTALPALPDRRAHALSRSQRARRLLRADPAPHPGAHDPLGVGRRQLWAARLAGADARPGVERAAGARLGRRRTQRALAPDTG
jgi:xylulokinase